MSEEGARALSPSELVAILVRTGLRGTNALDIGIRVEQVSRGLLDTILVHPREVFQSAISARAAANVLVHNHPSVNPTPSEADIKVTRDLIRAGQFLKIEIINHVILGRETVDRPRDFLSLRELFLRLSCDTQGDSKLIAFLFSKYFS